MVAFASNPPEPTRQENVLEVSIGTVAFCLPVGSVELIAELDLGPPPPMAHPQLSGIGFREQTPVVVFSPVASQNAPKTSRKARVVILRSPSLNGAVQWGLEISSAGRMSDVAVADQGTVRAQGQRMPQWVRPAMRESKVMGLIDVPQLLAGVKGASR